MRAKPIATTREGIHVGMKKIRNTCQLPGIQHPSINFSLYTLGNHTILK